MQREDADLVMTYLGILRMSLENEDYDTADFVYGILQRCKFADEVQYLTDELAVRLKSNETKEALKLIREKGHLLADK